MFYVCENYDITLSQITVAPSFIFAGSECYRLFNTTADSLPLLKSIVCVCSFQSLGAELPALADRVGIR